MPYVKIMEKMVDKLTTVLRIGERMQISIPKYICEIMGLAPGDVLRITLDKNVGDEEEDGKK